MMINTDDLLAMLNEKMEITAKRVLEDTNMAQDVTQLQRGKFLAFKELANTLIRDYGSDGQ